MCYEVTRSHAALCRVIAHQRASDDSDTVVPLGVGKNS